MNYSGYFNTITCNKKYEVRIITNSASAEYEEIPLAADQPFVVRYNTSDTPFDPVRTSTATINIVYDKYLEDALSNCAQDTIVELADITSGTPGTTVWIGYLTPKVFDAGYDHCYESFSLEAADCLSSLQYVDYEESNGGGIITIKSILDQICTAAGELDGYCWTRSKRVGNTILLPGKLAISEHNFQYNDVEEEWKMSDVLAEICRYLGFTALQYGKYLYLVDYQYLETHTRLNVNWYYKSQGYNTSITQHLDAQYTVTADSYKSGGASITFEPVYNKVTVNANMYAADEFIPNPFDDALLTNRINSADTFANFEVTPETPNKAKYPNGATWYSLGIEQNYKEETSGDTQYRYFHRLYDNKYWESVYSAEDGSYVTPGTETMKSSNITKLYRGGTICDLGVVRKDYRSDAGQWIVPSKLDYTRYICISEMHNNAKSGLSNTVYKLKDGFRSRVKMSDKSFLVLNCSAIFERYPKRNYINPSWDSTECSTNWMAAGHYRNGISRPRFRIHIGNKGWSSYLNQWVDAGSVNDYCSPTMRWDENNHSFWNKEISILNNVSWEDKVNCEGIKIPLSGIDTTQEITFEFLNPMPSFYGNTGSPKFEDRFYDVNAYCWISDFSLKCVEEGQEEDGNDSDVIYENVMDDCSVNNMDEIRVRLTTYVENVKPSYSHVLYSGETTDFLTGVLEDSLGNTDPQKPEENIIQKYVHQYGTPTKKITLAIEDSVAPFQRLLGVDVENPQVAYVQLGSEIDYRYATQTITTIEKQK